MSFNGHPPLGVNATYLGRRRSICPVRSFNGHPPLGVNATRELVDAIAAGDKEFQWAPTLGGECYRVGMHAIPKPSK